MADGLVTMRDDPITFELAKQWWTKRRICAYCGEIFTMLNSVGSRQCRIHTGRAVYEPWPARLSRMNETKPEGRLQMSCCGGLVIPTQFRCPVVTETVGMSRDPVRRTMTVEKENGMVKTYRNFAKESIDTWSGHSSLRGVRNNYQPAKAVPYHYPPGCRSCDHREIADLWKPGDIINVQNFAPMLALMPDVENRPGFQNMSESGDISRMG